MTPPTAGAAAPAISPRRRTPPGRFAPAPRRPRRVSGPARTPERARSNPGERARAVGFADAPSTHRLLDRLIRGRLWIGVIAFALIGIVTMQLGLLKLNAGIGRSLAREAVLQRENATLSAENSEMAAGERVEAQAEHVGMELVPSGSVRFLGAHPGSDTSKAVKALSASPASTRSATTAESSSVTQGGSSATTSGEASTTSSQSSTPTSNGSATTPSERSEPSEPSATAEPSAPSATSEAGTAPGTEAAGTPASTAPAGVSAAGGSETASPSPAGASGGASSGG